MTSLLHKELRLAIHPFFFVLPVLTGALLLIPQWPYFIALMYFFFISVPNIFGVYNAQNDIGFSIMMPVRKSEIVKAKVLSVAVLEMLHLAAGAVFALIHVAVYRNTNFMLDLNLAFFGISFIMFALFNTVFFPLYFKTAYQYGIPTIVATVIAVVCIMGIEVLALFNDTIRNILEGRSAEMRIFQLIILFAGMVIFWMANVVAYRKSAGVFENVDL